MRYVTFLFLFSLLIPTVSYASFIYIKVTNTTNTNKLKKIKSTLNKLAQKTTHRTTKTKYIVYSGPYTNSKSAKKALRKVKRYYPYAKIVKTNKELQSYKQTKKAIQTTPHSKNDKKYFLGLAFGYSSAPVSNSGQIDLFLPKEQGISYDLSIGLHLKESFILSGGYLRVDTKDVLFDNYYTSLSYKFTPFNNFTPYIGVSGGYSQLTWNRNPLDNSTTNASNKSDSFFGGTQIGAIYDGYETLSLYINYQCLFLNHATSVKTATASSELEHSTLQNIQFGVRYSF